MKNLPIKLIIALVLVSCGKRKSYDNNIAIQQLETIVESIKNDCYYLHRYLNTIEKNQLNREEIQSKIQNNRERIEDLEKALKNLNSVQNNKERIEELEKEVKKLSKKENAFFSTDKKKDCLSK